MTNLKLFCKKIQHANNNGVEAADCNAIKFDDTDGFVESLTANYANVCRVDYFEINDKKLVMIEMKDLGLKIREKFKKKPNEEELKTIFDNLIEKFKSSLKIIQEETGLSLISISKYLVWKNNTDAILMDRYLPTERPYKICKTNEICNKLSTLDTRLCQE